MIKSLHSKSRTIISQRASQKVCFLICLLIFLGGAKKATSSVKFFKADIRVTGKVVDADGKPLAGVSVKEKNADNATSTNESGQYVIVIKDNSTLVFSSVGFVGQEISVAGKTQIDLTLQSSLKDLNEVVVIGYGSANKRDLTGSIAKIAGKEVADKPNPNPIASLQGKAAGLTVVNSGQPGVAPDIRIRGTISKTQTKPLYVVDGIFNDNIDFVNPVDIESIEVLKDASSLAIFGVRGANGVIVITTKKGKIGQLAVNFNTTFGFQKIVDRIALTNAADFTTLFNEQLKLTGRYPYAYLNKYNGNSDWQKLISQNGFFTNNSLSIQSGTEKNRFYMGIGYIKQEGIIKHETLEKYILNVNDELNVAKFFKVGFDLNGYRENSPQLHDFGQAIQALPIFEPFNKKFGVYNQAPFGLQDAQVDNPLRVVEETKGQDVSSTYRIVGNVFTELKFLKKLTFRATYYADLAFKNERKYTPLVNVYNAVGDSVVQTNTKTSISQRQNINSKFQQEYLLTYKDQFGDHGITVLGGFSTNYLSFSDVNGQASQIAGGSPIPNDQRFWYLDNNTYLDPASRVLITPDNDIFGNPKPNQFEATTVSSFARVLYNYKGKYLLNASFRRDGSSDISSSHKYQNFEAVGAAWEITQEKFLQTQKIVNYLKLKASYGILGNQYTAIHYPFYPLLVSSGLTFGNNIYTGSTPSFLPDKNLEWETVAATDLGVEFAIFQRRLTGEVGYYNKVTNNLLTNYDAVDGLKPGITNAGKITNSGVEITLGWTDKAGEVGYSINGNLTTLKNIVNRILTPGTEFFSGPSRTRAGDPIASFYGYKVAGVYQNKADSASLPQAGAFVGDQKYVDVNKDGKIDAKDRTVIGNPTPKFTYGMSFNVNYKRIDLGVDVQGVYGNQIFRNWGNGQGFADVNYRQAILNRWHGEGTSNFEPSLRSYKSARLNSTYMIESGSYLRLRNIQLGYSIDPIVLQTLKIKSLRVYLAVQNIKTFKHNSGFTPDLGGNPNDGSQAIQFGVDNGTYPLPATYTLGLNIGF